MLRISLAIMALTSLSLLSVAQARKRPTKLVAPVTEALNSVLEKADKLHTVCIKRKTGEIKSALKELTVDLAELKKKSVKESAHTRKHLMKAIDSVEASVQAALQSPDEVPDDKHLRAAFYQLVNILRAYKTDRYRVFFCASDQSTWLQSSGRGRYPFGYDRKSSCRSVHPVTLR